jgi:hypothetical protein
MVPLIAVGTAPSVRSDQGKREAHAMNPAISARPRAVSATASPGGPAVLAIGYGFKGLAR